MKTKVTTFLNGICNTDVISILETITFKKNIYMINPSLNLKFRY